MVAATLNNPKHGMRVKLLLDSGGNRTFVVSDTHPHTIPCHLSHSGVTFFPFPCQTTFRLPVAKTEAAVAPTLRTPQPRFGTGRSRCAVASVAPWAAGRGQAGSWMGGRGPARASVRHEWGWGAAAGRPGAGWGGGAPADGGAAGGQADARAAPAVAGRAGAGGRPDADGVHGPPGREVTGAPRAMGQHPFLWCSLLLHPSSGA